MNLRSAVEVRDAAIRDRAAVAIVHVRAWQAAYRGLVPDEVLDGMSAAEREKSYTFGDPGVTNPQTIVAVRDGSVCGFVTVATTGVPNEASCGSIQSIYVDPAMWRFGVGRLLMGRARERLGRFGFAEAVLWMLDGNERAAAFYRRDGWAADGAWDTFTIGGASLREVRYRRRLP